MRKSVVLTLIIASVGNALPQHRHGYGGIALLPTMKQQWLIRTGRPEVIVEPYPRPVVIERPRPNVIVEQPRPIVVSQPRPRPIVVSQPQPVIGGLGGLVAGLGSALGNILTTDTEAPQAQQPTQWM